MRVTAHPAGARLRFCEIWLDSAVTTGARCADLEYGEPILDNWLTKISIVGAKVCNNGDS